MGHFQPEDDLMHAIAGAGPYARESWLWTAPVPDEEMLAFIYAWRTADERWGRFIFVGGPDPHEPLFLDHADDLPLEGDDVDDGTVGGLRIRHTEPLKTAEVDFEGDGLSLSIRFDGLNEPFSWHENRGGCPDWVAIDRYEQSVRTEGRLRLGDREVEFSQAGHRDHSWGARNWNYLQHWKWMNATSDDQDVTLHAMLMDVQGERIVQGYLNRDGEVSPLVEVEATGELDDAMIHRAVSARMVDEQGREARLEATYAAGWGMPIEPLLLNEIGMSATIDDRPAVAHVEFGWQTEYVKRLVEGA